MLSADPRSKHAMSTALTTPLWSPAPSHHSGRPPGVSAGVEISWPSPPSPQPAHLSSPAMSDPWAALDEGSWASQLANSSLAVEESANASGLDQLASAGVNKTFWTGGKIRLGVELELFPDWVVGVWTGVLVSLLVVGVGGNVLVPVVVVRTRDLRSSTNLLLVNLAAADLLVLAVSLPTALTELHSRPETWVLGRPMCMLVPFVEYCVCHASVLTILVISFERYYAICRPLRASYTCTKMRAWTCILSIWASAVLLSSPMLVMSKHEWVPYADGSTVPVCFTDLTSLWSCLYINVVTAVFFFVPLVLLVLLYLVIGRSLMQDSASAALHHRKVDLPNMKARRQSRFPLPFRVLTLWIVWTPNETIKDVGALRYYSMLYAARVLLFANSAVNPILYNLTSTKFRDAFLKLLRNERRRRRHLSRQSTFNTTGTSMSNGRSGSSRAAPSEVATIREHPARVALARWGRHASLDEFPAAPRAGMARYGRQSSFAGTHWLPPAGSASSSAACSRQNSRAGENGAASPGEARRCLEGEKRHSGEGRRLLEGERSSLNQGMIAEERPRGHLARTESMRRMRERKIDTEMDTLLSERPSDAAHAPTPTAAETVFRLESERPRDPDDGGATENGKPAAENGDRAKENGGGAEARPAGEAGGGALFCESLSTKVSLV
ncbi:neurotensin receptor type 1-like [Penaeus indicus]|uniref:neurotensin receptor type 1-like n=1 Tax=Penaeus indicus TaxID=29960 RepID=UPI00300DA9CE